MIKKISVLLFFCIALSITGGQEKDPDPSKKIKTKKTPKKVYATYYMRQRRGWKKYYSNKLLKTYNRKGQLTVKYTLFKGYPGTGRISNIRKYFYNPKGQKKEIRIYIKGKLRVTYIFTFDRKGRIIKQKTFRNDRPSGTLEFKFKIDKLGKVYEKRNYIGRKLVHRKSYHFSPKGYRVKMYAYDSKNRLKSVVQFDINGNKIKETKYFYFFKPPSSNKIIYKYDRYGNIIGKITFNARGKMSSKETYRNIY